MNKNNFTPEQLMRQQLKHSDAFVSELKNKGLSLFDVNMYSYVFRLNDNNISFAISMADKETWHGIYDPKGGKFIKSYIVDKYKAPAISRV